MQHLILFGVSICAEKTQLHLSGQNIMCVWDIGWVARHLTALELPKKH